MKVRKTPISIITGFLGSGKTTLINRLLPSPALAHTAVLVNEFGEISIDDDLIQNGDDTVIELTNGCVCCSLSDDLATTLDELIEKRESGELSGFDKVVIETTGLANAGPIVQILSGDPLVRRNYTLDRVVTTVDAVNGPRSLDTHAQSVEQVAVADQLVLTKLDLLNEPENTPKLPPLKRRLESLNPSASITDARAENLDIALFSTENDTKNPVSAAHLERRAVQLETGASDHVHHHHGDHDHRHSGRHDDHIKSFCILRDEPLTLQQVERFCSALGENAGPNLLRVKGIMSIAEKPDTPAVIHGVQEVAATMEWLDSWPSGDRRTRIVFIGWDLEPDAVESLLVAS